MNSLEARVRMAVAEIERRDRKLRDEMEEARVRAEDEAWRVEESLESTGEQEEMQASLALETIVLRVGRPMSIKVPGAVGRD